MDTKINSMHTYMLALMLRSSSLARKLLKLMVMLMLASLVRTRLKLTSCSYSFLLENDSTSCGANWINPEDFQCIALKDFNRDLSSHLRVKWWIRHGPK